VIDDLGYTKLLLSFYRGNPVLFTARIKEVQWVLRHNFPKITKIINKENYELAKVTFIVCHGAKRVPSIGWPRKR